MGCLRVSHRPASPMQARIIKARKNRGEGLFMVIREKSTANHGKNRHCKDLRFNTMERVSV